MYNEYQSVAAFAVASLLALLALLTLLIKSAVGWRFERDQKAAAELPPERPTVWTAEFGSVYKPKSYPPLGRE